MSATSRLHAPTHYVDTVELGLIRLKLERQNRILEQLVRGASLERLLTMIVELAEETRHGMVGSIILLDPDTRQLHHVASVSLPMGFREAINGVCIGPSVGSCGTAAFSKERVVVADILEHPYWQDYLPIVKAAGLRACWSEPILSSTGEVLGTFAMYYREPRHPEPEEVRFIAECATLAALAIERFRNDETIRESRRSHNALLSNLPGAAYRCQNDDNWTMEFISDSVKSLCGYEAAEFTGKSVSWVTLIVPEDRRRVREDVQDSLRQQTPFKIEYSIAHRDGTVRGIWEHGRGIYAGTGELLAIEGFMADVTKENQSQADASFLRALVESSPDAILGADLEGRIISANPAAVQLTGYSMKELINSRVWGASVPKGWQEAHATIERARVDGATLNNVEIPVISKDGVLRDLSISFTPVRGTGGNVIGSAITMRDQTELNMTRVKLVQSERLAAVGQMISSIAHESRNALQRIQVGVDMLGFELSDDVECRKDLDRISRAKEDLQYLFEDLRSYAAPLTLEHSMSSMANVWRQAWSNLESERAGRDVQLIEQINRKSIQLASGVEMSADHKPTAFTTDLDCEVDAFRLEQVFRNLIENSLAACSDPVEITIQCHDTFLDNRPALAISFRDNGPGLTSEERLKVFDAFYTTKQKGTGLGLAIAKKIVTAHFGTVDVGNVDSGGACIELVLPKRFPCHPQSDCGASS